MLYEKRAYEDSDTKLIKFTDKDPEGNGTYDNVTYVKFDYDLSRDQIESVLEASDKVEYHDYPTFDDWVEAVIEEAMKQKCWSKDLGNDWKFWEPYPCLEIEV